MKNVLIISGTPFRNDTNTGKTLHTLFEKYSNVNLHQLYFSIQTPNLDTCSSYYQIFEYQLLKSFCGLLKNKCGKEVIPDLNSCKPEQMNDGLTSKKDNIFFMIAKELLWRLSHWKNKNLKQWITNFKPDYIFAILPDSSSRADLLRWISKKFNCPIILFVTDDYYNDFRNSKELLRKIYFKNKQHHIDKMAKYCNKIVGCSELAAKEFGDKYNIPYEVIYTPTSPELLELPIKKQNEQTVIFRYFGNLGLKRWETLKKIGESIKRINDNLNVIKAKLEIYSGTTDCHIIDQLNITNACQFKGFVTGSDYLKLLQDTDVAIHVESFDENMIRRTRLSISTKIADYLGAGKCILALGPSQVASIQYISSVAYTISDLNNLENDLLSLINDNKKREQYEYEARNRSLKNHQLDLINKQVYNLFN